jgi:hypothetical protein
MSPPAFSGRKVLDGVRAKGGIAPLNAARTAQRAIPAKMVAKFRWAWLGYDDKKAETFVSAVTN